MARPREFDEDAALDRAMDVFWRQGYQGTSTDDLMQAMGIGRGSFYNTFGSKRDVYLRTLDRCRDRIIEIERERGEAFETGADEAFGLLQPGRVTAQDEQQEARPQQGEQDLFQEALRFDAERLLAEADLAFDEGRYNEALTKYNQLANGPYREALTNAQAQRAENRIAEIRVILQQAGGEQLEDVVQTREIQLQQARAEFQNFMTEADRALSRGDTEQARQLAGEARLRLAESRQVFPEREYQNLLDQQEALLGRIASNEESIRRSEQQQREQRLSEEARRQEQERQRERSEKIRENLLRIRTLQEEQKYEEALQVVEQLLFIDPQNPAGLLLRDTLQDVMIYREWSKTERAKTLSYATESNRINDALIIPENLLDYPSDWPEISFRRGAAETFAESAADRRVLAELESRRIPATFTDNALEDVLNFVETVTNLNMDVDWGSLADIGVEPDTLVTLNLQPLPARVVLDRVLEKVSPDAFSRAGWAVNDGVLVVASEEALRKNTFIVIYDVQDLLFQVPSFREVPDLDLGAIQEGGGGGQQQQVETEQGEGLTRQELLDRIIEIIQQNVDADGWRDNGGDTGEIQELNGNLIITNTAKNHRQISGLLRQLREVRSIQINVETRFLLVNEDYFEQIGFDLDIVFNADNSQVRDAAETQENISPLALPSSGRRNLLPSDLVAPFFGGPRFDSTANPVLTNAQELIDNPGTLPIFAVEATPFLVTAPDDTSIIPVQQNSKGLAESLFEGTDFANSVLGLNPALGVAATFLDDIQVDILLEATEADRRSVNLTSPRLTFTNGSSATISVVTQTAFVSDLQPVVGTRSVAFDPEPGVVSDGFFLLVDGVVSADRRYVTMEIQSGVANLVSLEEFQVSAQTTGGGAEDPAPDQVFSGALQQPTIQTTILRTGATVPDQGTLLLGGQRVANEVEIETGVPVLSQIPILNRLFTNRVETKEERTLLILLKPTILIQNEEEEKNFPGLLDSLQSRFGSGF
jgi:general secretion pathway protein D